MGSFSFLINEDLPLQASQIMLCVQTSEPHEGCMQKVFCIIPGDGMVRKEEGKVIAVTQCRQRLRLDCK